MGCRWGFGTKRAAQVILAGAIETADTQELLQRILTQPLSSEGIDFMARLDVVTLRGGACLVALSWSHLLLDGKGAELLLTEIGRLVRWPGSSVRNEGSRPRARPFKEKIRKTKAAVHRFKELERIGCPSLGGPTSPAGARLLQEYHPLA